MHILEQYLHLLEQVAEDATVELRRYSLLTARQRVLLPDPSEPIAKPVYRPISEVFRELAHCQPERAAVESEGRVCSYTELLRESDAIARLLLSHGLTRGDVVAIHGAPSQTFVAALLGTLICGGVFVTIDPGLSRQRSQLMQRQARVRFVLHTDAPSAKAETAADDGAHTWLDLGAGLPALGPVPVTKQIPSPSPADAAYIFFTSGTTGVPKGVLGTHEGIAHFLNWQREEFAVPPSARCAQLAAPSFDALLRDLFLPLTCGATLVLRPPGLASASPGVPVWLRDQEITVVHTVPSVAKAWLAATIEPLALPHLRLVLFAGEVLSDRLIERWRQTFGASATLINLYGPTETTMTKLAYRVPKQPAPGVQPIGAPMPETQALVLDGIRRCGIGEVGEIVIRTPFATRGYLDPKQTCFVANPFGRAVLGSEPDLLYYTGDLGRHRLDGTLEILGRRDQQLKINGVRIEPGEIEAALAQHPQVVDSVVIGAKLGDGQRLLAYVVTKAPLDLADLRRFLAPLVPRVMIPSVFVPLEALPLNRNGKVDRRALPAPPLPGGEHEGPQLAPRTEAEAHVAMLWCRALGLERVGMNDDFLSLGGDSITALQIAAWIAESFEVELTSTTLLESPTIPELVARIRTAPRPARPRPPVPRDRPHPLSHAQQGLWFIEQLDDRPCPTPLYNTYRALRLRGPLDLARLSASFTALVRRHESLRTSIELREGDPRQVIHPPFEVCLPLRELREFDDPARRVTVEEIIREEVSQPFELTQAPLWRAQVLRLGADDHVLLLTIHHIISDGWSMRVLLIELGEFYRAGASATEPPPLERQYVDYVDWRERAIASGELDQHREFWQEHLDGAWPTLDLPQDRAKNGPAASAGAEVSKVLPIALQERLRTLALEAGATSFMVLLAALQALLARLTGRDQIVVGTPSTGRTRAWLEGIIGLFFNTLPVRVDLSDEPSFRVLVARVREAALAAYSHQDFPFEALVPHLRGLEGRGHRSPFQVWLNMLPDEPPLDLGGVLGERLSPVGEPAHFPLSFYVSDPSVSRLTLVYQCDRFTKARARLILEQLVHLLDAAIAAPDVPYSRHRLPRSLERGPVPRPLRPFTRFEDHEIEQTIAARFFAQARIHADRLAVETPTHAWSYADLAHRVCGVARALRSRAPGARRVALLFEHDAPMIAGLLGSLSAGLAYVPLDPAHPRERLRYILDDSESEILLTNGRNAALAHALNEGRRPWLDLDEIEPLDPAALEPVSSPTAADALAYILYTSGSTGTPKGVVQSHRNVLHFIRCYTNALCISSEDRLTLLSSYGFDAAVMDIFGALLNGASLHPVDMSRTPLKQLIEWMCSQRVTIYHSTPTVYRHMLEGLSRPLDGLRLVVLGGEAVYRRDIEGYVRYFADDCVFVNGLGPTESTVSLQYFLDKGRAASFDRAAVPVGDPVAHTEVVLLDEAGRPSDVQGEIAIRSEHVAIGYWRRPEASARAFLPAPAGESARTYLTGDLGRYLPEGGIEFIGRKDEQIKINGYRVEPGEVEAALLRHTAVRRCVVVLRGELKDPHLVGYVVCEKPVGERELLSFMRRQVPRFMVPRTFVLLEALPETPTGKLDRRRLPAPTPNSTAAAATRAEPAQPRSALQELLAAMLSRVLAIPKLGLDEDFFALGGSSLQAVRLIAWVRSTLQVELSLTEFLANPSIAGLEQAIRSTQGRELPPLRARGARYEDGTPASTTQARLWLLSRMQGPGGAYKLSRSLRIHGDLDRDALRVALNALTRRHASLRTSFRHDGRRLMQRIAAPGPFVLPVFDLCDLMDEDQTSEIRRLAHANQRAAFDLEAGPLLRVALLALGPAEHLLLLTMHHLIADGVSMGIFLRELGALYNAELDAAPLRLPEPSIEYADFAAWQHEVLRTGTLDAQRAYWRSRLAGELPDMRLPRLAAPEPPGRTAGRVRRPLPAELFDALAALGRAQGCTPFMSLLAVFELLLHRLLGTTELVVGTPVAGRGHEELAGVLGPFVNTVVLRVDLSGEPTLGELLQRVRQVALEAYAHQDLPFETVLQELRAARGGDHALDLRIWVNMLPEPVALDLAGLRCEEQTFFEAKLDFDLSLYIAGDASELTLAFDEDLFARAQIDELLEQYLHVLDQIARVDSAAERSIAAFSLRTARAASLLPDASAPLVASVDEERALHEQISERARLDPERLAVVGRDASLRYGELDALSNRLARRLRREGARGQVVVIRAHRSPMLVCAVLGAMKAGACFMILEAAQPAARSQAAIRQARPRVLVDLVDLVGADAALPALDVPRRMSLSTMPDRAAVQLADYDEARLPDEGGREGPIYLAFTSGTTGEPRGILGTEAPLLHFLSWYRARFELSCEDRFSMLSGVAHDPLLRDIFAPLVVGATSIVPDPEDLVPGRLRDWIAENEITICHLTPQIGQLLGEAGRAGGERRLNCLRYLVFAGDTLPSSLVSHCRALAPAATCVNFYGATETPQAMSYFVVRDEQVGTRDRAVTPIGRGIADVQLLVLTASGEPAGIGEVGEIVVRTPFLAAGYLDERDEAGSHSPGEGRFGELAGVRSYRSGDLGRYDMDGCVEILGRRDRQLKIRGVRVEPAEVEVALRDHRQIRDAAVVGHDHGRGVELVAYLVAETEAVAESVANGEIRAWLGQRLPAAMLPASFVWLPCLPLTANGKLDRLALPAPPRPMSTDEFVAPRTATETLVVETWERLLEVTPIGVNDNFFALGGHSLLAMQMVFALEQQLGLNPSLRDVLERPTPALLAEHIDGLALVARMIPSEAASADEEEEVW